MIRLVVGLIVLALTLPTLVRAYDDMKQWSARTGTQAACAYGQQADLAAGRLPRTCP